MIACSISCWALSGLQSGVSYSLATLKSLLSMTLCAPSLNSLALLSVGAPLIMTIVAAWLPSSSSFLTRLSPWSLPTCSLSNEM